MAFRTTQQIQEAVDFQAGVVAADGDAGVNTDWVSVTNVYRVLAFVQTVDGEAVDEVQFEEATSDTGDDSQAIGDPVSVDARTGVVEIPVSDVTDGFTHVRATASTDGEHPVSVTLALVGSYRP